MRGAGQDSNDKSNREPSEILSAKLSASEQVVINPVLPSVLTILQNPVNESRIQE
jgi:hypothetical protein